MTNVKWWAARVLAVILPSLAIAPERERFTWDQVMLTNLSARDILLGKGLSRLLPSLAVVLFCLPAEVMLLTVIGGHDIPLQFRQQSGWITTVPLPVAWGIESVLQVLAVLSYAAIALLWSLKSRKSLNAFLGSVFTIILVGVVSMIVSWVLLLAFGFFHELTAFISQAASSPGPSGSFGFNSEAVRRMTLILSVYRFVVPAAIVFVVWRVMLRRFHVLDARVRGATFTPRPPRRNIVVPEAFAP